MHKTIFFLILLTCTIAACTKEATHGLVGKWKQTEVFNGYTNGGNFRWNKVPQEHADQLEFTGDGKYLLIQGGTNQQCIGTYIIRENNNLEIISSCQTVTENKLISQLASKQLILDMQGREGIIRYKYKAIK